MYEILSAFLENGLEVIVHRLPESKTVAAGIWFGQGSKDEDDANSGLSHLTEHLVVNPGNETNRAYRELIHTATAEGVIYNAATTKEFTCYYFTGLHRTLYLILECLSHIAMRNRSFLDEFVENEKKVVYQEALGFYSSFQQIKERTSQAIWGNSGIGRIIMGSLDNISNASSNQIEDILNYSYTPGNATLIIIGNVNYEEVNKYVEELFSEWEDSKTMHSDDMVDSMPSIYFNHGSGENAVVSIGFRTSPYDSKRRPVTDMISRIMGQNGFDSRVVQEVRVKRGLSYNVGSFSSFYKNRGTLGIMAVCDKKNAVEVAKVMSETIRSAKENGFTQEEIEREKKMMETSLLLSMEQVTDHLKNMGKSHSMGVPFFTEKEIKQIRDIEKDDIDSVAKDLFIDDNMGLAAIGECDVEELMSAVSVA